MSCSDSTLYPMTTRQLRMALDSDDVTRKQLGGVLPIDYLVHVKFCTRPCLFVVNTSPSWTKGKHWVCFYISANMADPVEFFDPLGNAPGHYSKQFLSFIAQHGNQYTYVPKRLQERKSQTCGAYALFFSAHRCRGMSLGNIVNSIHNDLTVCEFIKQFYDVSAFYR